uniref:PH domain-containing protein n=1 Tax=Lotharella globosa TaxID=91324 RepID=A0A7S4DNH2_9EUKA
MDVDVLELLLAALMGLLIPISTYWLGFYQGNKGQRVVVKEERRASVGSRRGSERVGTEPAPQEPILLFEKSAPSLVDTQEDVRAVSAASTRAGSRYSPPSKGSSKGSSRGSKGCTQYSEDELEDLQFYRMFLGRISTAALLRDKIIKEGLKDEMAFIGDLHAMRFKYCAYIAHMLSNKFIRKEAPRLKSCKGADKLYDLQQYFAKNEFASMELRTQFTPASVFDGVENMALMTLGKALFPDYRAYVDRFNESMAMTMKKITLDQLHKQLYKHLCLIDPELIEAFHRRPPHTWRWLRSGKLSYQTKKKSSPLMDYSIFSIELFNNIKGGKELDEKEVGQFVLASKAKIDPILIGDAELKRDDRDEMGFTISGPSALHPKKKIWIRLVASDRDERDLWLKHLQKFVKCQNNAQDNVEMCLGFFEAYCDAMEKKDYAAFGIVGQNIARHAHAWGMQTMRGSVPVSLLEIFSVHLEPEQCKILELCTTWLVIIVRGAIADLKVRVLCTSHPDASTVTPTLSGTEPDKPKHEEN